MGRHSCATDKTADGWDASECGCGWVGPPCPDLETALDFWADHVEADQ